MSTNLVKKALSLAKTITLFQEDARNALGKGGHFQSWKEGTSKFRWEDVIHLSQNEPGLLVAALLFFAVRTEEALERVRELFVEDGDQLSLSLPRTDLSAGAVNELLILLDSEYTNLVVPAALPAIRQRALERHGSTEGDSDEEILNPDDARAIKALEQALSDLMTRAREERLRIQQLAH